MSLQLRRGGYHITLPEPDYSNTKSNSKGVLVLRTMSNSLYVYIKEGASKIYTFAFEKIDLETANKLKRMLLLSDEFGPVNLIWGDINVTGNFTTDTITISETDIGFKIDFNFEGA